MNQKDIDGLKPEERWAWDRLSEGHRRFVKNLADFRAWMATGFDTQVVEGRQELETLERDLEDAEEELQDAEYEVIEAENRVNELRDQIEEAKERLREIEAAKGACA